MVAATAAVAGRSGYQPVLVDPDRDVLLAKPVGKQLDALAWVPAGPAERLAQSAALDPVEVLGSTLDTIHPLEVERWLEDWPDDPCRIDELRLPYHCYQSGPVILALVPAAHNWQVPVLLSYGYFNDCPHPSVHGAALRHWHQQYGLDVVAMVPDAMEFTVSRPPRSRRDALAFA